MMTLADALERAVMGGMDVDRMSLRGAMLALHGIAGTVTAAAKLAGIDRRTWQRYESGKVRNPTKGAQIKEAVRTARAKDRKPGLTAPGGRLVIKGTIGVSNDVRPRRKLDLSSHFTQGTRAGIVDAVAAGNREDAAERFETALTTDYDAPGMYVDDVEWLDWK